MKSFKFLILCLFVFTSCRIYDKVPRVGIGGFPQIKSIKADVANSDFTLNFNIPLNFHNPFDKNIPIPKHKLQVFLNHKSLPLQMAWIDSFTIPRSSDLIHYYPFVLDLNPNGPLKEFLGKDNLLTVTIDVEVNLKQAGIKVPSSLSALVSNNYHLTFSFSDTIRIPKLPEISPSSQFADLKFLGQMETFDLTAVKTGLEPFISMLQNEKFTNGYLFDEARSFFEAKVTVPDPTWDHWDRTKDINLVDYIRGLLNDDMKGKFDRLKDQLNPGKGNIIDFTLQKLYYQLGDNAKNNWSNFVSNWNTFLQTPLKFSYPGNRVTGIRLSIPFKVKNPNEFPIDIPSYTGTIALNATNPVSVNIKPSVNNDVIKAKQVVDMLLEMDLNWSQGIQGIANLINGASMNSDFKGRFNFDLGYGPMVIPYNIPLTFKWGQ